MPIVNNQARLHWLRSLRRFKYGVKVLAKLGVIARVCEQVGSSRTFNSTWTCPDWDDDVWIDALYKAIRDGTVPNELLVGFVECAEVTFMNDSKQPRLNAVLRAVDNVCNKLSYRLRVRFGVFTLQNEEDEAAAWARTRTTQEILDAVNTGKYEQEKDNAD